MAAHSAFDLIPEKEETEHIKKNVGNAPVGEHVGKKLPEPPIPYDIDRAHHHICEGPWGDIVYKEHKNIESDNYERGVIEFVLKGTPYD
jgi:hypothetical protein